MVAESILCIECERTIRLGGISVVEQSWWNYRPLYLSWKSLSFSHGAGAIAVTA